MKNFLNKFAKEPTACLAEVLNEKKLSPAFIGYALGIISLYFALKLNNQSYGTLAGFFILFLIWWTLDIIINFVLAALSHLFLDFTESKTSAVGIFILLGLSQAILTLLIPWFLIAQTNEAVASLTPLFIFFLLLGQLAFILKTLKKVYNLRKTYSVLAFAAAFLLPFVASFYFMLFLIGFISVLAA